MAMMCASFLTMNARREGALCANETAELGGKEEGEEASE